ncbi:MAG: hypothetical protein CML47_10670 [Rhodobacteraceae bacterium]|nr:MAG: hypothetical protein CML47_10670 [Paracoccaceae bacterium]|tara:strand:- start:21352 stop:22131 length:780 start_codon:yes stop_codon:yes gene_type:complete
MDSYVLIDLGYFTCYRYFAAKKWLGFRKELNQETPWICEDAFRNILMGQYEKNLKKLAKGKIPYLAMEGMDGKNWRKELYCDYKAQRPKNPDLYALFKYISNEFLPKFIMENKEFKLLQKAGTEADDHIALKTIELLKKNPNVKIDIISADLDFLQLVEDTNNIEIYDMNYKIKSDKPLKGQAYLKRKIIYGDNSDNIKPVHSGKGSTKIKQALVEYLNNVDNLDNVEKEVFEKLSKDSFDKFSLNRKLIDFNMISNFP